MASGGQTADPRDSRRHAYIYHQAVRDQQPVWLLEDMRTMEYFYWEENANMRVYSPSEALLYAVVHNHLPYAQYLLTHFPHEALQLPGDGGYSCPSLARHLAMAVTYDRRDILELIIEIARKYASLRSYINRTGCVHLEDGKTPLHLACELLRVETVLILLGNGASPAVEDSRGLTALDRVLEEMRDSEVNLATKHLCLEHLMLFSPRPPHFKLRQNLQEQSEFWMELLGPDKFTCLAGTGPPSLFFQAMQVVMQALPPARFPSSIQELPIPEFLKPLPAQAHRRKEASPEVLGDRTKDPPPDAPPNPRD
ncbi:ankyrin repeat domain-containing protein 9-like [Ornithorhynchus anatinus]|uniref:ankyrin repeat domain-containing protein 9-like n=1 Tax=Ornithorhynchus anatinus TaxID=9258 RepID=UPI00028F2E80|nr:ankyrin repeat domain-containing protein 9-like [Ornithorhynchus anatinus]XP_028927744.1 ankyrin repeat domain-containing protein 9-like [Ornithorhynchus anatinus]